MCMKVRVTDDVLQESCQELQSMAECLSISEKDMKSSRMEKQPPHEEIQPSSLDKTSSGEKEEKQKGDQVLDEEMGNTIREIVQSNRIHIPVRLFLSLSSSFSFLSF